MLKQTFKDAVLSHLPAATNTEFVRGAGVTMARKIGYAVIGLGDIAQEAVLPAFAHATGNSRLVALCSSDETKRRVLGKRHGVPAFSEDDLDACLAHPDVDALYIALPNSMHAKVAIRAARAGVHVLCEKPMAVTEAECTQMIAACRRARVKLMIAYRLHFEPVHLGVMAAGA